MYLEYLSYYHLLKNWKKSCYSGWTGWWKKEAVELILQPVVDKEVSNKTKLEDTDLNNNKRTENFKELIGIKDVKAATHGESQVVADKRNMKELMPELITIIDNQYTVA